jgi:hypothetical protein
MQSAKPRRITKAIVGVAAALVAAAGGWVLYTFPPATTAFYPRCVFHSATGLDCPGCGSTRAVYELLHGHVGAALRLNPFLFLVGLMLLCTLPSVLRGQYPRFLARPWFGWTSVVVTIGWWIVRNTPLYPY